jgi:nitroreductase
MRGEKMIETIRSRRSIRGYQPAAITREQLETIVDCGRLAPSAMNEQRWEFVAVREADTLDEIARLAPDNGPFIADAMACIVVCGDALHRSVYLDGAAATENMLLAIHAMGFASCWVQAMDKPYSKPIAELLGIPDSHVLVALVPVGMQFDDPPELDKRPLEDVLHWERF